MRIKKLELIGFKSFKDRTVIHFDGGITGVVGPNGCGKSNIVDALVWVMGEMSAKHLRGASMEDVIFAGAEGYAPVGLAEVSLTLENDGGAFPAKYSRHSEIMVTRRLHRSGESEYLVNKESARLRDVQEIFMDTGAGSKGFSIIAQGAIGKIITAKPDDRRMLIEEAAGITKFKVRKRESQRKLTATDQNLVRLQDIIGELKRQLDSLQRQKQRAERYRKLKEELEDLDLWLSSQSYFELNEIATKAQKVFEEAENQNIQSESELGDVESQLQEMKLRVSELESQVNERQRTQQELQVAVQKQELENQELKFEIEQERRNEEMTGSLIEEQKARKELLEKDYEQLNHRCEEVKGEATALDTEFNEKNQSFENFNQRVTEIDHQLSDKRREMLAVSQSESHFEAKIAGAQGQVEETQEQVSQARSVLVELGEKQTEFEKHRKKIFNDLEKERQLQLNLLNDVEAFQGNREALNHRVDESKTQVEEFKDRLNEVTSRLYGLENLHSNFEGFSEGVKNVMLWQRQRMEATADGGVQPVVEAQAGFQAMDGNVEQTDASIEDFQFGSKEALSADSTRVEFQPVADVIEVPSEYEIAMEAALGQKLQMILSQDHEGSLDAISHLKEKNSGRSSFLSTVELSQGEISQEAPEGEGVVAVLKDVVSSPDKYQKTVSYLLDKVIVVDSIRTALRLRPERPGWTFVTPEGDSLSAEGVLTGGGSESADSGILKRKREIKELSQQKEEWAGKLSLAQASLKKVENQLFNVVEEWEQAQQRKNEQEIRVAELKKDLERAETEYENAQRAVSRQEREVSEYDEKLLERQTKKDEIDRLYNEACEKRKRLEEEAAQLETEFESSRSGIDSLQEEVTSLRVNLASKTQELEGVESQREMVKKSLSELEEQLSKMTEDCHRHSQNMSSNQMLLEEKKIELEKGIHEHEQMQKLVAEARDEYEQQTAELRTFEEQVSAAMKIRNELQTQMNEAKLELEQARLKEQNLIEQVRERYMLQLPEVVEKYREREGNVEEVEKQVKDIRGKLNRIGEVNLSAIEEYDETEERYKFLSNQYEDLVQSKEQLRKVIDRINRICSKRFKETFDAVNARFKNVFPVLFGGGEAKLVLIEDPEKQDMGIEIIAKPPGKKMQSIMLMSGGEKALTAVALIFSIFLVKPSPYCLLDEVDAPLDDANVVRFNDLVREMAKRSQIIVVTHNKYTMEVASKLYGVTMQEKGVSKMVSVSLDDAQKVTEG